MVLQQLLRMRSEREEALRRKFFQVTGLEEEDENVRIVVRLTDNPQLLEISLQCKHCGYEALMATILPEDPDSWVDRISISAGPAVHRFKEHSCKNLVRT